MSSVALIVVGILKVKFSLFQEAHTHFFPHSESIKFDTSAVLTFGKGQHPQSPERDLQHVLPLGHWYWPPGHMTYFKDCANFFSSHGFAWPAPSKHFDWATSQVWASGQQCSWSEQHTAFREQGRESTKYYKSTHNLQGTGYRESILYRSTHGLQGTG